jgi:hypothetical protein
VSTPAGNSAKKSRWTLLAALLAIVGLIVLTGAGLCTAQVSLGILASMDPTILKTEADRTQALMFLYVGLAVGVPTMLLGLALVIVGFRMRRGERS